MKNKKLFGKQVQSPKRYRRIVIGSNNAKWVEEAIPIKGLFIGTRTCKDGKIDWDDNIFDFSSCAYFEVGLIVEHMRQVPVPVPLHCINLTSD